MKIIHCADLHLDSKLNTHLTKEKAKERRGELLNTFVRMVDYASGHGASAILIAGDMFDTGSISRTTLNTVVHAITEHPEINFYYLEGNHDDDVFIAKLRENDLEDKIPDNLRTFGEEWTSYSEAGGLISISGIELCGKNSVSAFIAPSAEHASPSAERTSPSADHTTPSAERTSPSAEHIAPSAERTSPSADHTAPSAELNSPVALTSLSMDANRFNIVILHGQESEAGDKDKAEVINLNALRYKNIDYLALGHIHSYRKVELDPRCTYCYPGCLEGRGFDECGEHGFVELDIDENNRTYTHTFIPFAKRRLYEVEVDVTGLTGTAQMVDAAQKRAKEEGCDADSMVKFILTGEVDVECEKDPVYMDTQLKDDFYFIKVEDKTGLKLNIDDYRLDESLKGEFVRQVLADESIRVEDQMKVIRFGLQALAGEEIL